jgi:hypothetical protein
MYVGGVKNELIYVCMREREKSKTIAITTGVIPYATTEDGIVRARQQTRESPKDNERPLRTGIHRKKNKKN